MGEKVTVAANTADILGESAVWEPATRAMWWVDMRRPALHRLDVASGAVTTVPAPACCPAILPLDGGDFLVALGLEFHRFDPARQTFEKLLAVEPPESGNRLNDSKCDRQGRLWAGTMRDFGAARTGALYRRSLGRMERVLGPVTVPNALCFSPGGDRVYFTDTRQGAIRVADLGPDGAPSEFRLFAADGAAPGKPDGATVDANGFLWSARFGGGCVARFAPDGRLDGIVEVPATQVTSCAFGGDDLRVLYVTTARQRLSDEELAAQPLAGALFAIEPGVRGLPETPCRLHR
jgi:sugar lactone lactonase YvrE